MNNLKNQMKVTTLILSFLFISIMANTSNSQETCTITYIANDGFLIETGSHKILIDALFGNINGNWCDQPSDSVLSKMTEGIYPFNNIDILFVSHNHADHFNADMTLMFLNNNQKSILICPQQVNKLIQSKLEYQHVSQRVYTLNTENSFDTTLNLNNLNVRALRFNHSAYYVTDSVTGKKSDIHTGTDNIGYIIESGEFSLFHSGDDSPSNMNQYAEYKIEKKNFDAVFLDRMFLRRDGIELIEKYIHSNNIIFMHIEPGKADYYKSIIQTIPEMHVFTNSLEQKNIRKNR
jgi:L-ascorbate metabolism protein UlaG (beta-lactamase superfamily)